MIFLKSQIIFNLLSSLQIPCLQICFPSQEQFRSDKLEVRGSTCWKWSRIYRTPNMYFHTFLNLFFRKSTLEVYCYASFVRGRISSNIKITYQSSTTHIMANPHLLSLLPILFLKPPLSRGRYKGHSKLMREWQRIFVNQTQYLTKPSCLGSFSVDTASPISKSSWRCHWIRRV